MTGRKAKQLLWMILKANNGFHLERSDMEDFPGDDRATFTFRVGLDKSLLLTANTLPTAAEIEHSIESDKTCAAISNGEL